MKIIDCEQGTPEWWEAKKGVPSASNFDRILTPVKAVPTAPATQEKYIAELIADRRLLRPKYFTNQGKPVTPAMQEGIDREPEARAWYAMHTGLPIVRVGFCVTDDLRFGCSPDALVGDEGGLELKVPQLETHVLYLMKGVLPSEYKCQVHGSLIVTGRKWWDFVSYPAVPGGDPLVVRTEPDDFTDKLRHALDQFWERYMRYIAKLGGNAVPAHVEEPIEYPLYDPFADQGDIQV